MSRGRGDDDADWKERRGENINRETLDELWESQHASAASLHICLFIPGGDCNSRRNRARVRSPLPLHTRNICLLTQARCPVTQALARLHPRISLSCLFLSLSLSCCLWWSASGWQQLLLHIFMAALSPSATVLHKPTHTQTDAHWGGMDSLSWNSKAEHARGWHYKVEIYIKI